MEKVYDLQSIYDKIKGEFFPPDYEAAIRWGRAPGRGRYRHITFGTYDLRKNLVRIHPWLDDEKVPLYFIEFVVYHEMLHAVCPPQIDGRGCCRFHTAEFRRREKLFPQFDLAKEWEKGSLLYFKKKNKKSLFEIIFKRTSYGRS